MSPDGDPVPCRVLDRSTASARLAMSDLADLSRGFLVESALLGPARRATVIWCRMSAEGFELGVRLDPTDPVRTPPSTIATSA